MVNKAVNFMTICLHFISGSIFCDSSHQAQSAARRRLLYSASLLGFATPLTLSYSSFATLISCPKNSLIKKVLQNVLHFGLTPCKTEEKTGNILPKNFQTDRCYTKNWRTGKSRKKIVYFFTEVSLVLPSPYFSIAPTTYHVLHQNRVQRAWYDTLHRARQWLYVV